MSRVSSEQLTAIDEWFEADRDSYSIDWLAGEFVRLRALGCDWPVGTKADYAAAIVQRVNEGRLRLVDGKATRVGVIETVPTKAKSTQLNLF